MDIVFAMAGLLSSSCRLAYLFFKYTKERGRYAPSFLNMYEDYTVATIPEGCYYGGITLAWLSPCHPFRGGKFGFDAKKNRPL